MASEEVLLLQHPSGMPAVAERGHVRGQIMTCIIHDANTLPGSSGSPIFIRDQRRKGDWKLVAVHCRAMDLTLESGQVPLNAGCLLTPLLDLLEGVSHGRR